MSWRAARPAPDVGYRELAASLGITYRQLDHWVRQDYLHPEYEPVENRIGNHTGYARQWPECELAIAAAMGRLVRLGLTVEAAHRVARKGRERWVAFLLR